MERSREQKISAVTTAGAIANLILCAFKLTAGILGKSSAMISDAVHSLSDLVSDVVVIVMVQISGREKDSNHDYGHGKFETMAALGVSILLLLVGGKILLEAVGKIIFSLRGGAIESPGSIALWAAFASIVVKEALFQWNNIAGKRLDSPAMKANAWHHRSDALSSVGSAIGIGGAIFLGGRWTILDPIAGCIISIILLAVAVKMIIPAVAELTDASLPDDVEARIAATIKAVPGVESVHELRTRRMGREMIIGSHLVVNPTLTVLQAHDISTAAEAALRKEFGDLIQVSFHIEPAEDSE